MGMQSMQNTMFFCTFETDFCTKSENSPPIGIINENACILTLDMKRIRSQKSIPEPGRTLLLIFFFFGLHLILGTKPVQFLVKTFFFRSLSNSGQKTVPISSENRFSSVLNLRNTPPFIANSWLSACG